MLRRAVPAAEIAPQEERTWLARGYAATLVALRWLVLAGCLAGLGAALVLLPNLRKAGPTNALSIVPRNAAPVQTEKEAVREFGLPLLAQTVVVVRNPHGLTAQQQAHIVDLAVRVDRHLFSNSPRLPGTGQIAGALPVLNTLGLFPSANEHGTTALLFLYSPPSVSAGAQAEQASAFAQRYLRQPAGTYVGVTGITEAQRAQNHLVGNALPWVELAALLVIALVVGLKFRCIGAPLVALATAGFAYEIAIRLIAWAGQTQGIAVPGELEPLIAVLVAGVTTDYSIFLLSAFRERLREQPDPHIAARHAIAEVGPIVLTAGISVVAGTASLRIASLKLFGQLGPGMALSVAVSALAGLLFLPAMLACAGRGVFWPGPPETNSSRLVLARERAASLRARALGAVVNHRVFAALALFLAVAALGAAATGLSRVGIGTSIVSDLPSDSQAATAARQAATGFAEGTIAPTEVVLFGQHLDQQRTSLAALQRLLEQQPGIAGVIGPADVPTTVPHDVLLTKSGSAARYVVMLSQRPDGAGAIETVNRLQDRLPGLLAQAGLRNVRSGLAGDTALSSTITTATAHDISKVALLAIGLLLLILIIYLRAFIAPVLLMAATVLSVAAALGLTTYLFQDVVHTPGLTFYVPFATAVLLLSFGSDYNIFLVGRIWQQSSTLPFRERVVAGATTASRAITAAGITLAMSFALLAIVPLAAFREFAFAMVVGVLLDTFIVRSVMVPAMLTLLGSASAWPSKRLRRS